MSYRMKAQAYEAMQYTGTNNAAMVAFAPNILTITPDRKLMMEFPAGTVHEVVATTWIVARTDWYENVRDGYFHKTYELIEEVNP